MHICVGKLTNIGSDNDLSPGRRQAIIWTNAGILLIGPLWTNFSELLIVIHTFSFNKMHLKMSSAKWRPFCLGLNVLSTVLGHRKRYRCHHLSCGWPSNISSHRSDKIISVISVFFYVMFRILLDPFQINRINEAKYHALRAMCHDSVIDTYFTVVGNQVCSPLQRPERLSQWLTLNAWVCPCYHGWFDQRKC